MTMCIAAAVRERNAELFAPDFEFERSPDLLVGEPALLGACMRPDRITWVRVYFDGSALDHQGTVHRDGARILAEPHMINLAEAA